MRSESPVLTAFEYLAARNQIAAEVCTAQRILLPQASATTLPRTIDISKTCAVQTYRSEYLQLQALGFDSLQTEISGAFEAALVFPGRNKSESLYWLSQTIKHLEDGAALAGACENDLGAKSYIKLMDDAGIKLETESKARCTSFAGRVELSRLNHQILEEWAALGELRKIASTAYYSGCGIFSSDRLDPGSALLVRSLPRDLSGAGADFCAGNGYIGIEAVCTQTSAKQVTLFENDLFGVNAAKQTIDDLGLTGSCQAFWTDLLAERPADQFDWIVMNPPFHGTQGEDRALGGRLLISARDSLKNGGQLFVVANEHLAFHRAIEHASLQCKVLAKESAFCVYLCLR